MRFQTIAAPRVLLALAFLIPPALHAAEETKKWDPVPAVDFSTIKLEDFHDDELDLPYYLGRFHELCDAIVETGPDRGFINKVVWRAAKDNKPYNARVMESHLSFAWFYTQSRPWNPYYNSPAVRQRLEAMLTRLCNMQNDDGRFNEYGPKQWNLPATAFATKFLGETITLLKTSEAKIDPALLQRVIDADKKAILATLTLEDLYKHGKSYTNQFGNVFAGAAAYLALFPDPKIKALYDQRFKDAEQDFQSPCGYFYEANGPDFGYTLGTHHNNVHVTYFYLHDTPIGDGLIEADKKWNDWLGYNLLRQPDGSTFVANRGVETRQQHAAFEREDGNLAEKVPAARAFATSKEERQRNIAQARQSLAKEWSSEKLTRSTGIPAGGSSPFSPYVFLQRRMPDWYPLDGQRDIAIRRLPYMAKARFIHQRVDPRMKAAFTYVRRPGYYAIFNSGAHVTPQQRLGLGLLWTPMDGTLLQTQTNSADHAWGTRPAGGEQVYEATDLAATFAIGNEKIDPQLGNNDLPGGTGADADFVITYPLGEKGKKTIAFRDFITVRIEHPGEFAEQIPLVNSPTTRFPLSIDVDDPGVERVTVPGRKVFGDSTVTTTVLKARDQLTYRIRFVK